MSIVENVSGTTIMLKGTQGGPRLAGVWKGRKDTAPGDAWFKAATESIAAAEGFRGEVSRIRADARLSDVGKAQEIRAIAAERLKQVGAHAKRTADVRRMVRTNMTPLAPFEAYKSGDLASVMIDIALAQTFRSSSGAERDAMVRQIAAGTNPQLAAAVLRLPQVLSGASENLLATAKDRAIAQLHPIEVEKREEIESQSRTVANALHEAVWDISEVAGLSANEVREILGENRDHIPVILRHGRGTTHEPLEPLEPAAAKETDTSTAVA